jgi:hypothetical protein
MSQPEEVGAAPVEGRTRWRTIAWYSGYALAALAVIILVLMFFLDTAPEPFDVLEVARQTGGPDANHDAPGYVMTATLAHSVEALLDKRGGYLSNDKLPPGVVMDNIPNWEWGVLRQARDLARSMRNDMSRSQTQSAEDPDLVIAETKLHIDSEAWLFPAAEDEYRDGVDAVRRYLDRLAREDQPDAQFYARADNLREWLALIEKRLGDLSQRLSASVGQVRINTDLRGDPAATQSTATPQVRMVKTPWRQIDDVFYEARGASWALIHYLKAAERDFGLVLENKNALVSLRQVVRELESTQDFIWSPVILNGTGFGMMANHSLVMASYISRAHAAVIDLRNLLSEG